MPKYVVSYDRMYTVIAENETEAMDIAETEGNFEDMDIFIEEVIYE